MSSITFSETKWRNGTDWDGDVTGGVRILEGKPCAGVESLETKFYRSFKEDLSDRVVEGNYWSISLAMTAERNVKKVMSTLRSTRSETNVGLPEESRKPTSWRLPTLKSVDDRIHDAFRFTFHRIYGKDKICCYYRRQITNGNGSEGRMRKKTTKKKNENHRLTIRFGADCRRIILRIVSSLLPTTVSWNASKKDTELTTLVLAIHANRVSLVVVVILIVVVASLSKNAASIM